MIWLLVKYKFVYVACPCCVFSELMVELFWPGTIMLRFTMCIYMYKGFPKGCSQIIWPHLDYPQTVQHESLIVISISTRSFPATKCFFSSLSLPLTPSLHLCNVYNIHMSNHGLCFPIQPHTSPGGGGIKLLKIFTTLITRIETYIIILWYSSVTEIRTHLFSTLPLLTWVITPHNMMFLPILQVKWYAANDSHICGLERG